MADRHWWRRQLIDIGVLLCIGLFLGVVGPFGSYAETPTGLRILWWTGMTLAGWAIYKPITMLSLRLADHLDLPGAMAWVGAVIIGGFPASLLIGGTAPWIAGGAGLTLSGYLQVYGAVLPVGLAVTAVFFLINRDRPSSAPAASAAAEEERAPEAPSLVDRLPHGLRGPILCLQVEDHYVRVHTAAGNHMLLMRLKDAIRETGVVEGAQVHRSWWVARAAVTAARRDGRGAVLTLVNGLEVPVARSAVSQLVEAGWLA